MSSNSETVRIYTFFEASRFGCHKTIFDATKITYNKYSCAISGMNREMMKMDGQDRAEYQNWEKRDINVIFRKVFKSLNAKLVNSVISPILKTKKRDFEPESPAAIFFERLL